MPLSCGFTVLGCWFAFGFLGNNPALDQVWGSLHYLLFVVGVNMMIYSSEVIVRPLMAQVVSILGPGHLPSSSRIHETGVRKVIQALEHNLRQLKVNAAINTLLNLMMGCVPILLRKASYQMPFAWFCIACGAIDMLWLLGRAPRMREQSKPRSERLAAITTVQSSMVA
jgi:hypothetical protein